ncbi:MAG: DUF362 domain-containing protein [Firmicutes bacterium]|nr:DUF362 domain-containing protein [Bacillota bacterium]
MTTPAGSSATEALNPFVRANPDAVFIMKTELASTEDRQGFEEAGYRIVRALLRQAPHDENGGVPGGCGVREGRPDPIIKPNVVDGNMTDHEGRPIPSDGVVTDVHFVAGITRFLQEAGYPRITVAEGGDPRRGEDGEYTMEQIFRDRGYREMADRLGLLLVGLNKVAYGPGELQWRSLGDRGVVFKEIPFVRPFPGEFVINVPTLKTHYLAMTSLSAKNLQGTIAVDYRHHCQPMTMLEGYPPELLEHFQPDFADRVKRLCERHEREGYWRMNVQYELFAQRTCDTILAMRPQPSINIIEGIRGRDGTAFRSGRDWLTNLVVAGVNPVNVDTVASFLMGQTPKAVVAYLRIAEERGLGTCDPFAITTYVVDDDGAFKPCERLSDYQVQPFLDVETGNGSLHATRGYRA